MPKGRQKKPLTDKDMLVRLADRLALVMVAYWAKTGNFQPFCNYEFWQSNDAFEIRAMPEYQQALEVVRELLRDPSPHDYMEKSCEPT